MSKFQSSHIARASICFLLLSLLAVAHAKAEQDGQQTQLPLKQTEVSTSSTYQVYIPLFSALAGALIGGAASTLTIWLQSRSQERRDRLKLITDLAIADQKSALEFSKGHEGEVVVPPLVSYVGYYRSVLDIVAKRSIRVEDISQLAQDQRLLMQELQKLQ